MEIAESRPSDKFYHSFIKWNIYNFFNAPLQVNDRIESPEFVTNLRERIKWRLAIIARRKCDEKYVTEIFLKRLPYSLGPNHILVNVRIAMIDNSGRSWFEGTDHICFFVNTIQSFRSFYEFSDIMECYKPTLSRFDKLLITCDIVLDIPLYCREPDVDTDLKALSLDLKTFISVGNLCDLHLKVGRRDIAVHCAIVKARSPYIARILNENPFVRQIDLTDRGSYDQIKALIRYWYSGNLETLPRMPPFATYNFLLGMEQFELVDYVYPEVIELSTTFDTINVEIKWNIHQFSFYENLDNLEYRTFYSFICEGHPWCLDFYPKNVEDNTGYISLCIQELQNENPHPVYLEIFLTDGHGAEYGCQSTVSWLHTRHKYSFQRFMTEEEFRIHRRMLLEDDILRIGCRLKYGTGVVESNVESVFDPRFTVLFKNANTYATLAQELKLLLESEDMSDIFIKTSSRIYRVHRAVLAARSRHFNCMLKTPESNVTKHTAIKEEDIEPEYLDMILKYMYYAEKIQLNVNLALKLYPILHKYKITLLESSCTDYLQKHLNIDNACYVMKLGNIFQNFALINSAHQILSISNHQLEIKKLRHFQKNNNAKLSKSLYPEQS